MPSQVLSRFFNSFDLKAWDELGPCLAESIFTDYSDLRGTPPETVKRGHYVESRRKALENLKTHHLTGNHEITITEGKVSACVSSIIFRRDNSGKVFNTHCLYLFDLAEISGHWVITSIIQKVFWNDGDPKIHRGIGN